MVALLGANLSELHVGTTLDLLGHVALLDLGNGSRVRNDRESGSGRSHNVLDVGLLGVTGLGLAGLAGEDNETLLVGLEAGDVGSEGLLAEVLATVIDGDTDSGSVQLGDTSGLHACQKVELFFNPLRKFRITLSSAREKPRPARTRRLYLMVGHRTMGLSLSTGLGARAAALAERAPLRRIFWGA